MNCSICSKNAKLVCTDCISYNIFCYDHADEHYSYFSHTINMCSAEFIKRKSLNLIKSEIKKCINQIASDSSSVISSLKQISRDTIKLLKESCKNIENLEDFKEFTFNKDRVSMIIQNITLINEEIPRNDLLKAQSDLYSVFAKMSLEERKEYAKVHWDLDFTSISTIQLLLSNDELFVFECKIYLGI